MEPKEITVQIPGGQLAGLEWNSGCTRRVLALHGWLDNAASFSQLAAHLPGYRVVALDLVGHGKSSHRPHGVTYHFVDYVRDVVDAAAALGWNRYILLGHSLGAGIASLVASVAQRAVSELVLIDGIGPIPANNNSAPKRLAQSIAKREKLNDRQATAYPDWLSAAKIRKLAGDLSLDAAQILVKRGAEQHPDGIRWRSDPRLKLPSPIYIAEEQARAFLAAIAAPTLLIRVKQGLLDRLPGIDTRIAAVPGIQVVEMSGGHHLHLDDPQPVAQQIIRFLQS